MHLGVKQFLWSKVVTENLVWGVNLKSALQPCRCETLPSVVLDMWVCLPWVAPTLRKEKFSESTAFMIQALMPPLIMNTSSCFPKSSPWLMGVIGRCPIINGFPQKQESLIAVRSNPSPGYWSGKPAITHPGYLIRHWSFWDGPKVKSIPLNLDLQFLFVWDCWGCVMVFCI